MSKVPFDYSGFWDVPRFIRCKVEGTELLLESEFDDSMDDYSSDYKVYASPPGMESSALSGWAQEPSSKASYLGSIPVSEIEFDATKRNELEAEPLVKLLQQERPSAT